MDRGPLTKHEYLSDWAEANNEFEMTTIPQIRSRRLRGLCVQLVQLVREVLSHVVKVCRRLGADRRRQYRQVAAAHRGIEVCAENRAVFSEAQRAHVQIFVR